MTQLKFRYGKLDSIIAYEKASAQETLDNIDRQGEMASAIIELLSGTAPKSLLESQLHATLMWKTVSITVYLPEEPSDTLIIDALDWITNAFPDYELEKTVTGGGKIQYRWKFSTEDYWDYSIVMGVGDANIEGCKIVKKRTWSTDYKLEC